MTYTLDAAMRDGIAYYYAGTVNAALLALFNETGKSVAEADKALRDVADAPGIAADGARGGFPRLPNRTDGQSAGTCLAAALPAPLGMAGASPRSGPRGRRRRATSCARAHRLRARRTKRTLAAPTLRRGLHGDRSSGSNRINRGGRWDNNASNCRSANRNRNEPGNRNTHLGFRLALSSTRNGWASPD
jgi:hypothetical protein